MPTYDISKQFEWDGPAGERMVQVCRMFGLTLDRLNRRAPIHSCRVEFDAGDIVFITGPSGSGKSVLLGELERQVPESESINLARIGLPSDKTVIDCFDTDVITSLKMLSRVGLSSVFSMVNKPCHLSEGQQYRFRMAQALATGKRFVFADEFASGLDVLTAMTLAFNLHKFAKRTGTTFILASSRRDCLMDLCPDVIVTKDFTGPAQVTYKTAR